MRTDPKVLFHTLLKKLDFDLVLDIGSCDGGQSVGFRMILPEVRIVAFEANPHNFRRMVESARIVNAKIHVEHLAVSNENGTANFHVWPGDYSKSMSRHNNIGQSSLLPSSRTVETVEVKTIRLDEYLKGEKGGARVAAWIDVEGVEYFLAEGMSGAVDKIRLLHVETAVVPTRTGQKNYAELEKLLVSYGYERVGSEIPAGDDWGDVVFLKKEDHNKYKFSVGFAVFKSSLIHLINPHRLAMWLREFSPSTYQLLRLLYTKLV